jgi:hypothetical protein
VPKRHFTDLKTDARVFAARAPEFSCMYSKGQNGSIMFLVVSLPDLATVGGAVDAGGSDLDVAETALVQNVNRRLDLWAWSRYPPLCDSRSTDARL